MSDPKRLVEERGAGLQAKLLRAATDEPPPDGAVSRALVGLGLGGAVAGSVGTAAASSVAGPSAGLAAKSSASLGFLSLAKWAGVGVVAGAITLGGAQTLRGPSAASSVPQAAVGMLSVDSGVPPTPASNLALTARSEQPSTELSARALGPGSTPRVSRPESTAPSVLGISEGSGDPVAQSVSRNVSEIAASAPIPAGSAAISLGAEVALLDQARAALAAQRPDAALLLLDRHAQEFPRGSLQPEAMLARLEALMKTGQTGAAQQLGGSYLQRNPTGPLSTRVRSILAGGSIR